MTEFKEVLNAKAESIYKDNLDKGFWDNPDRNFGEIISSPRQHYNLQPNRFQLPGICPQYAACARDPPLNDARL